MTYAQLLTKLARLGLGQVSRMTTGGYDEARIGKPKEVIFPFPFRSYPVILENGPDTEIDEEIIDGILRFFDETRAHLDPPN
jgi:hypothetical protein